MFIPPVRWSRLLMVCLFTLLGVVALWLPSQLGVALSAPNSKITVNSPADVVADDGMCTLREAITAANTDTPSGSSTGECGAGSGADTIVFSDTNAPFTVTLAISGTREDGNATGDLDILSDVTIQGNPTFTTTIDANQLDRVLDVVTGTVAIQNIYLLNGRAPDGASSETSGEVAEGGGAIRNQGQLNLYGVVLMGNRTGNGGDLVTHFNGTAGDNNGGNGGNGGAIDNSGTLVLENVAFMDNETGRGGDTGEGAWSQSSSGGNGGNGGGLYNSGNATLTDVIFQENRTGRGGSGLVTLPCPAIVAGACGGSGGGIFSSGSLTVATVEIQSSITGVGGTGVGIIYANDQGGAGGNGGVGGGIYVEGTLAANDLSVSGNVTGNGGNGAIVLGDIGGAGGDGGHGAGLYLNLDSQTLLQQIQSFDNQTGRGGVGGSCLGAICDNSQSGNGGNGAGLVNITEGTILEQSAIFSNMTGVGGGGDPWVLPGEAGNGGGVWTIGAFSLVASTISSNTTQQTANGGGVFFSDGTQLSTFFHSTIANNQSLSGEGGGLYGSGYVNFVNSILGDNQAVTYPDCVMVIVSQGYNIIENTNGCTITGTKPSDQLNVDPQLAPLDGTIHPLLPTSSALDAGFCFGATSDQRGLPRPVDLPQPNLADGCDIGAYEVQAGEVTPTPTVTPTQTVPSTNTPTATSVPLTPTPTGAPPTQTPTLTATSVPSTHTPTATSLPSTPTATATLPSESGNEMYLPLIYGQRTNP